MVNRPIKAHWFGYLYCVLCNKFSGNLAKMVGHVNNQKSAVGFNLRLCKALSLYIVYAGVRTRARRATTSSQVSCTCVVYIYIILCVLVVLGGSVN